jgi:hypothetical protein
MMFLKLKGCNLLCFALAALLSSCNSGTRDLVFDEGGIFSKMEHETLQTALDAHMRTGKVPIFVWVDASEKSASEFADFQVQFPGFSKIKKALVVYYHLETGKADILRTPPTIVSDKEIQRIHEEVYDLRLRSGLLFEGIFDVSRELIQILNGPDAPPL